eukprot:TRINITY_DN33112_c0_g1_i1.p1 TRINITY_DN33112_c0_g1~~TRINITY_DN33112_c0_g1_i1.p1  ORF type:complete len:473 (+),score=81.00 TRINITY_DN33112_c0_g1_i1:53-1471(+)
MAQMAGSLKLPAVSSYPANITSYSSWNSSRVQRPGLERSESTPALANKVGFPLLGTLRSVGGLNGTNGASSGSLLLGSTARLGSTQYQSGPRLGLSRSLSVPSNPGGTWQRAPDTLPKLAMGQTALGQTSQRMFSVGYSRSAHKVQLALDTKDDESRLRRFEGVLDDPKITWHSRLSLRLDEGVTVIKEEIDELLDLASRRQRTHNERAERERKAKEDAFWDHRRFLEQSAENQQRALEEQRLAAIRAEQERLRLLEEERLRREEEDRRRSAEEAHRQQKEKNKRRALIKMKMAAQLLADNMEHEDDPVDENGEVDLRKTKIWNPHFMWISDIEEKPHEKSCDFLFLADISKHQGSKTAKRTGRCIFNSVMYDLQKFTPEWKTNGMVEFSLTFGVNTAQRRDVPNGWNITYAVKALDNGTFEGTCSCAWWGDRPVIIMPYSSMTEEQLDVFPDPVAKYYKTLEVASPKKKAK